MNIMDPAFKYTPSFATDIRLRFAALLAARTAPVPPPQPPRWTEPSLKVGV